MASHFQPITDVVEELRGVSQWVVVAAEPLESSVLFKIFAQKVEISASDAVTALTKENVYHFEVIGLKSMTDVRVWLHQNRQCFVESQWWTNTSTEEVKSKMVARNVQTCQALIGWEHFADTFL